MFLPYFIEATVLAVEAIGAFVVPTVASSFPESIWIVNNITEHKF